MLGFVRNLLVPAIYEKKVITQRSGFTTDRAKWAILIEIWVNDKAYLQLIFLKIQVRISFLIKITIGVKHPGEVSNGRC